MRPLIAEASSIFAFSFLLQHTAASDFYAGIFALRLYLSEFLTYQ
jgi:hypothetical protein